MKSKTVADQDWHLNDDNKSVKTIGTNSFKSGINKKKLKQSTPLVELHQKDYF